MCTDPKSYDIIQAESDNRIYVFNISFNLNGKINVLLMCNNWLFILLGTNVLKSYLAGHLYQKKTYLYRTRILCIWYEHYWVYRIQIVERSLQWQFLTKSIQIQLDWHTYFTSLTHFSKIPSLDQPAQPLQKSFMA